MISQALQYPFRGKESFRSILILVLVQLLPIIGQLILLGYGLDVVRAVYAGQINLPPIRWLSALGNGFRILLAGIFYLIPILVTIAVVGASGTGSSSSFGAMGVLGIVLAVGLPLVLLLIRTVSIRRTNAPSVQQPNVRGSGLRSLPGGLLPILMTVAAIFILRALVSSSGLDSGKPNELGALLFLILFLFLFLIGIVLYIGGARYAIENKGLLAPMANARLLLKNRALTGALLLNVLMLGVIAVLATTVGLVMLILPGLFAFVICSLALWYMFAQYSIRVGIYKPDFTFTSSITSIL